MLQVAPAHSVDQGGVSQPRPLRQATPRTPLTLSDLRTPSPSPAPSPAPASRPASHAGPRGAGVRNAPAVRKLGSVGGLLHSKEAGGAAAGRTPSPRAQRVIRYGGRGTASPQELRLSHLGPASPSPSPPASCSSYYDSINSDGPPASPGPGPGPALDRLMQVEVAFEWSPICPQGEGRPPMTSTQVWSPTPSSPWPSSPRLPHGAHSPSPASSDGPRPWPPDSLEGAGVEFEAVEHMRSQLVAMNGAARHRGARAAPGGATSGLVHNRLEGPRVRPRGGLAPRPDQDLNSRVHQILTRIASRAQ